MEESVRRHGPAAPKDPEQARKKIYLMAGADIESVERPDGRYSEIIYLEGRVEAKVNILCPGIDQTLVNALPHTEDFRKIVHSIGVSVMAGEAEDRNQNARFQLQMYGKSDKYVTGSILNAQIPLDGTEVRIRLDEIPENSEDDILGTIYFYFDRAHISGKTTICFYLNEGYDVPEPELDPPVRFESTDYQDMVNRSLIQTGNTARLAKMLAKAARGEEITVAYIGGSITQGAGAKPQLANCYVYRSFLGLKEMLGTDRVRLVKAGVGGTSSEFGIVRYDRDVRKDGAVEPDLVIVEYAVNDEGDETQGICYESLVRKILNGPSRPAVVLLFAVFMNDWNLQDRLQPVGKFYDLAMVSVKDAVVPQFYDENHRVITKRQFFYDLYHPTNDGHRIMSDCLLHLFGTVREQVAGTVGSQAAGADPWSELPNQGIIGTEFSDLKRYDRAKLPAEAVVRPGAFDKMDTSVPAAEFDLNQVASKMFTDNWHYDGSAWKYAGEDEKDFVLQVTCKSAILVYKDEGSAEYGAAEVYVDGNYVRTLDPLEVGWLHCNTAVILSHGESEARATVHEIRVRMRQGDEKKKFTILGFGIVD